METMWHRHSCLCGFGEMFTAFPTLPAVAYYKQNLPHWHPQGTVIFLSWRLHGTYTQYRCAREAITAGRAFAEMDREWDQAASGPKWLSDSRIAQIVKDALMFGERQLQFYQLIAYGIMPNHVHVVLSPRVPVPRLAKSIKGFTAREANKILGRTGESFWQDECYDRWVRGDRELQKVIRYVERDPVSAGFVDHIEAWPWSSAFVQINTGKNACATP